MKNAKEKPAQSPVKWAFTRVIIMVQMLIRRIKNEYPYGYSKWEALTKKKPATNAGRKASNIKNLRCATAHRRCGRSDGT